MWLCLGSVRPLFKRVCKGLCKVIFLVVSCGVVLGRCTRERVRVEGVEGAMLLLFVVCLFVVLIGMFNWYV